MVRAGFDYLIDKHWGWNVDLKKRWLRPNWDGTLANGTAITGKVNLDPWLIGPGITYKFWIDGQHSAITGPMPIGPVLWLCFLASPLPLCSRERGGC